MARVQVRRHDFAPLPVRLEATALLFDRASGRPKGGAFAGMARRLGHGGLVLEAALLERAELLDLLAGRAALGVNLRLPLADEPVKALAHLEWIEPAEEGRADAAYGLRFLQISPEDAERLGQFIARAPSGW